MDWEKKLKELNEYNISFEIKQGYYHIVIIFNEGWNVLSPDNEAIYVQEKNGIYHYIASMEEVKMEELFNTIDATIEYNKDLEKKLLLFKQKTQELQELFANEEYETLQTLDFVFNKKKETKKTVKKTKNKTEKKEKTTKKTKTKSKKDKTEEVKQVKEIREEITQSTTPYYDENEEIVVMNDTYMEELERK